MAVTSVPVGAEMGVGVGVGVFVGVGTGVFVGVGTGVGVPTGKPQVCGVGLQPELPEPMVTFHDPEPSQLSMPPTVRPLAVTLLADPVMVLTLFENANSALTMFTPFMATLLIGWPPSTQTTQN